MLPCIVLGTLDPWVIRQQWMDPGKRIRYPSEETMANFHSVLDTIAPNINTALKACVQLPWVNLRVAKMWLHAAA